MLSNTPQTTIDAIKAALSLPRISTYEAATQAFPENPSLTLQLYSWNAEVSGAFLAPLHICEIVTRNAVADALEATYGPLWPWSASFERSLPNPQAGYSPRRDLQNARRNAQTTSKVIPELSFVFWQKMFTSRYDTRIWTAHLHTAMPNLTLNKTPAQWRQSIYTDLERIRRLRNRIAHHEPIFSRALASDYQIIHGLIEYRCKLTAAWLDANQNAISTIAAKPNLINSLLT